MCTVTLLPEPALAAHGLDRPLLRVVFNRDEQRTRAVALPPAVRTIGGRQVVMPVDPVGGGSWLAVSDRGLVFALLNVYDTPATEIGPARAAAAPTAGQVAPARASSTGGTGLLSRGLVVPALAGSDSITHALTRATALDVGRFGPFRLLLIDRRHLIECWSKGGRLHHRRLSLHAPVMRTSSGLGDAAVLAPRRRLFRRFFGLAGDPRLAQDAFHDHQWPGREDISVRMARTAAHTVSRTMVEVATETATVWYLPTGAEAAGGVSVTIAIDARGAERCA